MKKILVANRGEIAVRILRTCREMGLDTVAVYSDADADAAHVLAADTAVRLGPADPAASYLDIDRIIDAARTTGADAIHPGYGFLAENPLLATACEEAGIVFVGPPAQVIRDLGDKTVARRLMKAAGVPVIPGSEAPSKDLVVLAREAEGLGYPVLLKAAGGGGGKGMRRVDAPGDLAAAFAAASGEAMTAFGDERVYLERCLVAPRHVEFQILGDTHGQVIHLYERECSIQRRHQKIIEETPSPGLTAPLRAAMGATAVDAAKAAGYVNAGTVEFLLDEDGSFYFLEVNTRLQVEHPITEVTLGIDLVRKQLEIAAGAPLGLTQEELCPRGHAIECRIYAEDPAAGFLPAPGKILAYRPPGGPGVRLDDGVYEGFEVPIEYDPILGKLIVHAPDREAARARMIRALESYAILGIETTISFLRDVLASAPFVAGETRTDFVERHFSDWSQDPAGTDLVLAAALISPALRRPEVGGTTPETTRPTPWQTLGSWRL
ncbi:MAG: acetyl-CoA carboxylase biotin carboxylase subunit [Pseudomonadota bacterium]